MKKITTLVLALIATGAMSQTTYNVGDYGTPGYGFKQTVNINNLGLFDFAQTGTNHTWNYATLTQEDNALKEVLDPNSTDYHNVWIAACSFNTGNPVQCNTDWNALTDIARIELDSLATPLLTVYELTSLMELTGNDLIINIEGAKVKDTAGNIIPVTADFEDVDTALVFPLNYNNTHTSKGKWRVDLNPLGYDIILVVSYTRNYTVEGWGSLVTPYKLHNDVLKMRTQIDEIDSLYYNGFPFGQPRTVVQYTWFDPGYGMPVMEATGQKSGSTETMERLTYLDSTVIGINEDNLTQLSVFPNPTTEKLTVDFKESVEYTHAVIMDATGKVMLSNIKNIKSIDVTTLAKGSYFVGIYNNDKPVGFKQFSRQ